MASAQGKYVSNNNFILVYLCIRKKNESAQISLQILCKNMRYAYVSLIMATVNYIARDLFNESLAIP